MPTTVTRRNQRFSFADDTTSHIAVMPLRAAAPAHYAVMASAGRWRLTRSPDVAAVLIFSAVGLLASICLQLLLPVAQETAFLLAQFG